MRAMTRRDMLRLVTMGAAGLTLSRWDFADEPDGYERPNIVFILIDDGGYGDLGCYGSRTIRTPNVDAMAAGGVKFTQIYSASPLCTPSRAALMTGRQPLRTGSDSVIGPRVPEKGLNVDEITLAQVLKKRGYAAACIGKWHLGFQKQFLPTSRGFDYFYGLPFSNDMTPCWLMCGEEKIEEPPVQATLTQRYTQEALKFIRGNKDRPFFLYLPHTMPHLPLAASPNFKGKSAHGLYGDVLEEIDWSTGEIVKELKALGLTKKTIVVFTSDNGPVVNRLGVAGRNGSTGGLRGEKGQPFEGGIRVPCVVSWEGKITPGRVVDEPAVLTDWFTTIAGLAGAEVPQDRVIDGQDLRGPLFGTGKRAKTPFFFTLNGRLLAIRSDDWKLVMPLRQRKPGEQEEEPMLFDLAADSRETNDLATAEPERAAGLKAQLLAFGKSLKSRGR